MGSKIRLVIADVDGTLVTEEKILTQRAQAAVHALHDAGIRFAITSGRPPRGMGMLFDPLSLDTPIAGFNGGLYVHRDLTILEQKTLPGDVARQAVQLIRSRGLDAWIYSGNDWLITKKDAPHVAREAWTVKFEPTVVPNFDAHLDNVAKIVGISDDHALVQKVEAEAQAAFGQRATANRSQPYYLDVTHQDANKGAVVDYLSQHLGIPAEQIATIGDSPNDVRMFKRSGFSIAMGNASAEVKAQAKVTTDGYNDEGFAKAMERHVLATVGELAMDDPRGRTEIVADPAALARRAAEWMTATALAAATPCRIALSGGSTPKALYALLASNAFRDRFPWDKCEWYWGDERFVPHDHPESNYRMTREAMFSKVPVSPSKIFPIPADGTPEEAALRYEQTLQQAYGSRIIDRARPLFEIMLLGMGDDGHTASLLPNDAALEEHNRWVLAIAHGRPEVRITLTLPVIESSRHAVFLVAGTAKAPVLAQIRAGGSVLPAARVNPVGELLWLVDRAAASGKSP